MRNVHRDCGLKSRVAMRVTGDCPESRRLVIHAMLKKSFMLVAALAVLAVTVAACIPAPWDIPSAFGFGWGIITLPFALIGVGFYFLPTIIAAARHAKNFVVILLVNIFAGWTGIGWVLAVVWSIVDSPTTTK